MQKHPIRNLVQNLTLLLASILMFLLLLEGAARLYVHFIRQDLNFVEFMHSRPEPYKDAPYYGKPFLAERLQCLASGWLGEIYVALDRKGQFCNVRGGMRATINALPSDGGRRRKILMAGGSTLFSQNVPDAYTIPSRLQALLNQRFGPRFEVYNLGMPSMGIAQQLKILKTAPIAPGDIVLFYDGVNDIVYPVYHGIEGGLTHRDHGDTLALFSVMSDLAVRAKPMTVVDEKRLQHNLEQAATYFYQTLLETQRHVQARGGVFYHFLQPHLFADGHLSDYERQIAANPQLVQPGMERAYAVGYPRLRQAMEKAAGQGVKSFDISDALNQRSPGVEFFFDHCHVNHLANERIARRILQEIKARLQLQRTVSTPGSRP